MKIVGPRSLYTKMLRLADELHHDAQQIAEGGNTKLAIYTEQISVMCKELAERIGEQK